MPIGELLNPILNPLLALPPTVAVAVVSFIVSLIIAVITKYTTDQNLLKKLREEIKEMQQAIKKEENKVKAAQMNKDLMKKSLEQTKHSMRSMFFTLIPILIIFSWMSASLAYLPLEPQESFTTTVHFAQGTEGEITISASEGLSLDSEKTAPIENSVATFELTSLEAGEHTLEYQYGNEIYQTKVIASDKWRVADPILEQESRFLGFNLGDPIPIKKGSDIISIETQLDPVKPFPGFKLLFFPAWLTSYIFFSIVFTFGIRKILKVQ